MRLGRMQELLVDKAPPDLLTYQLNRVFERVITSGEWTGLLHIIGLVARYGEISLPRYYGSIKGIKVDGFVRNITNRFWEFMPGRADTFGNTLQELRDLGNKATLYSIPLGGRQFSSPPTVAIVGDGTGASAQAEVKDGYVTGIVPINTGSGYTHATVSFSGGGGFGANALPVIESGQVVGFEMIIGGTLTLSYPGIDTLKMTIHGTDQHWMPVSLAIQGNTTIANPFSHIDSIHREQGKVVMTLTHTSIDNLITPLAIMEPGEMETGYRRYIIDQLATRPSVVISALAKLRHIELENDADIVPFHNLFAIEQGLRAINYLNEGDVTLSKQFFAECIDALNDDLQDSTSGELATLRTFFPGNTQRRMSSTM